jgi:hypothetical protein
VLADKGYHGAGQAAAHPYQGRGKPESQKNANRAHARLRGVGERANAQLKDMAHPAETTLLLRRAGHLAKAIHVLQARESEG